MDWQFCRETPIAAKVRELAEPVCASCGVDLFLVEVLGGRGRVLIRVMIDAIDGVDVEDCAKVSQRLSAALDVAEPLRGPYNLEVSSPGLDRPLRNLADARKAIGANVRVETGEPVDGRRRFFGKLLEVSEAAMVVEVDSRRCVVPADRVRKANLVYEFGPIGR
jgi:ribosome maturation factor RimP